jgi:phosphoadenosine phosphosulfate reductase
MACLHLCRDLLDCAIFVDTGYAYPETRALVEYAKTIVPVHVVQSNRPQNWIASDVVPADWTEMGQQFAGQRPATIRRYFDCCFDAIVNPLMLKAAALGVTELVNGQRNSESRKSPTSDGDTVAGIVRRQPIENWTSAEVLSYLETKMDVPAHYYTVKHSSLDCFDCTAYARDSGDRVEWMRGKHPALYAKYASKRVILEGAIREAMA